VLSWAFNTFGAPLTSSSSLCNVNTCSIDSIIVLEQNLERITN
jgi:hypothetical protein